MNFNSLAFLIYLPIVLLVNFLLPKKIRWIWLLIASYYFYMSWSVWFAFLILGTTAVSYVFSLLMEKTHSQKLKKVYLASTLIICLGLLFFFKYFNFLLNSVIAILEKFTLPVSQVDLNIMLPVGISFYTFQTLSYVIDVYRAEYPAEHHFGYYALFVSFFPQLVAGPIEKPGKLLPQLKNPQDFSLDNLMDGLRLLLVGFFYKCVVADILGIYVNNVFGSLSEANGLATFIAGGMFLFQMFGDFAGYSEIAAGSAKVMGIDLSKNFNQPYLATSFRDYFRRWHITLTSWFTHYLYIPLGGSRKGKVRTVLNTFIVFALCGLWHGANWTYVLWGLNAALFISIESVIRKPVQNFFAKHNWDISSRGVTLLRRAAMAVLFSLSAILFRATSIADIGIAYVNIFTKIGFSASYFAEAMTISGLGFGSVFFILLALAVMHFLDDYSYPKTEQARTLMNQNKTTQVVIDLFLVFIIAGAWIYLLSDNASSAFAYFQF